MKRIKYKKSEQIKARLPAGGKQPGDTSVLGMLYIVNVRLKPVGSEEIIKHTLLLVGCESADIERKMRWLFDSTKYQEMSITGCEKVREKVHFLNTIITQPKEAQGPVIDRDGRTEVVEQSTSALIEKYDPKLFAIGISTTMLAKDAEHAIRKTGHALISSATVGQSHSGAALSEDSTLTIEEIPRSSGYAMPRDVSQEANRAHIMRG